MVKFPLCYSENLSVIVYICKLVPQSLPGDSVLSQHVQPSKHAAGNNILISNKPEKEILPIILMV